MSLSEDEKKRMKEEEIYRQEMRAELEKAKPSRSGKEKVWEFINSALGLWVLSTVLVGSITLAYSIHLDSVKTEEVRKERSQKLEAEISNRQKETLKFLAYLKDKTKDKDLAKYDYDDPRWIYKETVMFMDGKNDPDFLAIQPALYKEFKEESLAALLTELEHVSKTKAADIKSLRTNYDALEKLYSETLDRSILRIPCVGSGAIQGVLPTEDDRKRNVEAVDKAIERINSK